MSCDHRYSLKLAKMSAPLVLLMTFAFRLILDGGSSGAGYSVAYSKSYRC
jgi:hypothetical protein